MVLKNAFGELALDTSAMKAAYLLDVLTALAAAIEPSTGRVRTQVDTSATINVGTLTNMAAIGGQSANSTVLDIMQSTWATNIRPLIT